MAGKRPLNDDEIQRILQDGFVKNSALRDRALFALGITTGYRISEIVRHKVGDVLGKGKQVKDVLYLPPRMRKGQGFGQTKRIMPFAIEALQAHINDYLGRRTDYSKYPHEWLFLSREVDNRTGEPKHISPIRAAQILTAAFERCEVIGSVNTHSMRKTFAMKVYRKAIRDFRQGLIDIEPLRVVQLHLGHASINSTLKYMESIFAMDMDESDFDYTL